MQTPAVAHPLVWSRRSMLKLAGATIAGLATGPLSAAPALPSATGPLRLNFNESAFGPSPKALAAIRDALGEVQRYVGADEADALVAQIADLERVERNQVLVGEVLEALGAHLALSGPSGGEFVYSEPGYTALVDAVAPYGGKVVPVPLDARAGNDLPALAAKVGATTRAVFVVNPHNPSGTLADAAAFRDFVRTVAAKAVVIVDEAYLDYVDDAASRSAAPLVRDGANVIVFRTLSKIHGLAGASIGYALAPPALVAALRQRGIGGAHSINRLSLVAARASLADREHLARVRATVTRERATWHALLDDLGLRRSDSRANFVFFDGGRPQAQASAALLRENVRIARAFPPYDTWLRISIGLPTENDIARAAVRTLFT